MNKFSKLMAVATLVMAPIAAHADWRIDASSSIGYVSTKNATVAENNTISGVSGSLTDAGTLSVSLDLTTVDTGVSIRNERMQQMLFEVFDYASAEISANLTPAHMAALTQGEAVRASLPVSLMLHGAQKTLTGDFLAVPTDSGVVVTSTRPILVNAADFGLEGGVAALQEIAGLASISRAVPVTVDLLLTPAGG